MYLPLAGQPVGDNDASQFSQRLVKNIINHQIIEFVMVADLGYRIAHSAGNNLFTILAAVSEALQ